MKNLDERFDVLNKGKSFNEKIDGLKQYWWEKETKPLLENSIEQAIQQQSSDLEVLIIMKELLNGVKIKKMDSYVEELDGK